MLWNAGLAMILNSYTALISKDNYISLTLIKILNWLIKIITRI